MNLVENFLNLENLPLPSQDTRSLLLFPIRNRNQFLVNSDIYLIDTRQHANFNHPSVNLTEYQKGMYYLGVEVFNMFPSYFKLKLIIAGNLNLFYINFYTKISFVLRMNILNFKKVKFIYI